MAQKHCSVSATFRKFLNAQPLISGQFEAFSSSSSTQLHPSPLRVSGIEPPRSFAVGQDLPDMLKMVKALVGARQEVLESRSRSNKNFPLC